MTNLELKEQQGSQGAPNIVDAVHAGEVTFDVSKAEMQGHQAGPDIIEALDGTNLMNLHDFERAQQQGNQCPPLIKFGAQPGPDPDPGTLWFEGGPNGGGMVHMRSSLSSVPDLQYSTDGTEWYDWPYNTSDGTTVFDEMQLAEGQRIYVRGTNSTLFESISAYAHFLGSGYIAAGGNIQSLVTRDVSSNTAIRMQWLFYNMTCLISVPSLPATTLTDSCYRAMFNNCTALTALPDDFTLPATTLADNCYSAMFQGCISLVSLPEGFTLPATTLAASCYSSMFSICESLTALPEGFMLPATTLAESCYNGMFYATGLLALPNCFTLPALVVPQGAYAAMFSRCKSLTTLPDGFTLPATTIGKNAYAQMFTGCDELVSLPDGFTIDATTFTGDSCCFDMFNACKSLRALPEGFNLPATVLASRCYSQMFSGCTALSYKPSSFTLPATTLADRSYMNMFADCKFPMSSDGTTFNFFVGVTFPYSGTGGNYANPKALASYMRNTRGFN